MRPFFTLSALLLSLPLLSSPALAAKSAEATTGTQRSAKADAAIARQLDALGYHYKVDDDGDYQLTFELDDERTQLVYVISSVEEFGSHHVREVWSPAYRSAKGELPAAVANRLLEDSQSSKLGGWVKQGDMGVFVVKLPANASQEELDDAIDAATRSADQMESELTPGQDEF